MKKTYEIPRWKIITYVVSLYLWMLVANYWEYQYKQVRDDAAKYRKLRAEALRFQETMNNASPRP